MDKQNLAEEGEMLESSDGTLPSAKEQIETTKPSVKIDFHSPRKNDNSEMNTSCGQKVMFPLTFGYEEAKSPRSPLGAVNLNANFKSPVSKPMFPMTFGYQEAKSPRSPLAVATQEKTISKVLTNLDLNKKETTVSTETETKESNETKENGKFQIVTLSTIMEPH